MLGNRWRNLLKETDLFAQFVLISLNLILFYFRPWSLTFAIQALGCNMVLLQHTMLQDCWKQLHVDWYSRPVDLTPAKPRFCHRYLRMKICHEISNMTYMIWYDICMKQFTLTSSSFSRFHVSWLQRASVFNSSSQEPPRCSSVPVAPSLLQDQCSSLCWQQVFTSFIKLLNHLLLLTWLKRHFPHFAGAKPNAADVVATNKEKISISESCDISNWFTDPNRI